MINSKRNRSKLDCLHFNVGRRGALGSRGGSGRIAGGKKAAVLYDIVIMASRKLNGVESMIYLHTARESSANELDTFGWEQRMLHRIFTTSSPGK